MAVLACWLGLSLLVRAPRDRPTQAFAWLCLHLTLYGLTIVLPDLTDAASVRYVLERIQLAETVLLPAVFFHFIMVLVGDGPAPLWQYAVLIAGYASGLALAGYALFGALDTQPDGTLLFPPPLLLPWTLQRAVPMLMALLLMFLSYRQATGDDLDRRRRALFALSAVLGVIGALWATAARNGGFSPAPGHALMDLALALLAYAVLAYRSLLPARGPANLLPLAARRHPDGAVYQPAAAGRASRKYDHPDARSHLPLVTTATIIVLIAIFGPLRDWAGAWIDRRFFHREFDYGRLLRAVGEICSSAAISRPAAVGPDGDLPHSALRDGAVAAQEGQGLRVLATYGAEPHSARGVARCIRARDAADPLWRLGSLAGRAPAVAVAARR